MIIITCSLTRKGFAPEFALNYINYCCSGHKTSPISFFSRSCQGARPLVSPNWVSMSARPHWFASSGSERWMSGQLWPPRLHCCANKQRDVTLLTAPSAAVWTLNSALRRPPNRKHAAWGGNTETREKQTVDNGGTWYSSSAKWPKG